MQSASTPDSRDATLCCRMLPPCYIVIAVLGSLVLLHLLFELHYFTRSLLTVVIGLFCKKNRHILDTLSVKGRGY
ncbi:hypothetical protein KUF71_015176 [Frankliniella fusca]|uniref:Uncharacterized protein n=1 Tax=Frankliniella fusca TaxID=407009 RepID=A0AAE1LPD4_9NEOP|nr:hypothetical protein KUF71_015176 [Frankliniella fusca]